MSKLNLGLLALCICSVCCQEDSKQSFTFDVIPGGSKLSHEETWNGVTCKFTYACQGGTKENWEMHHSYDGFSGNHVCVIGRPADATMSYLFFQEFEVTVTGSTLVSADVYGSNSDKPAHKKEFDLHLAKNKVSSSRDFQSSLTKIVVWTSKEKLEL